MKAFFIEGLKLLIVYTKGVVSIIVHLPIDLSSIISLELLMAIINLIGRLIDLNQ
jgi:hypothetical protein